MEIATLPILTNTENFKVFVLNHRQRTDKNKQILSEALALELRRSMEIFGSATENWGMHPSWQNESNIMATQDEWLWENRIREQFRNTVKTLSVALYSFETSQ